jgi:hypothetical protein
MRPPQRIFHSNYTSSRMGGLENHLFIIPSLQQKLIIVTFLKQTYWELMKNFKIKTTMFGYVVLFRGFHLLCVTCVMTNDNCKHRCSCMTKNSKLNVILYTCLCKFRPMGLLYKFVCYMCDDNNQQL